MNRIRSMMLRIGLCLGLTFALGATVMACGDDPSDTTANQQQNDRDNQDNQSQHNDDEQETSLAEAHQFCAAAGPATDGSVTALHCSAPKGASGNKATSGSLEWHPGAFHVIAR